MNGFWGALGDEIRVVTGGQGLGVRPKAYRGGNMVVLAMHAEVEVKQ